VASQQLVGFLEGRQVKELGSLERSGAIGEQAISDRLGRRKLREVHDRHEVPVAPGNGIDIDDAAA
jgi:hypothetical protein